MAEQDNVFQQMREVLQPKGTAPLVRLFLGDAAYFDEAFVRECIDDLERTGISAHALGEPLTPLQKLAMNVLTESALITI